METNFVKRRVTKRPEVTKKSRKARVVEPVLSLSGSNGNGHATADGSVAPSHATRPGMTIVRANIDIGFGNTLFIRGEGNGLSWEKGLPLACMDASTWTWWTDAVSAAVSFKLLVNDSVWSKGQNYYVPPGTELSITPSF